MPKGEEMVEIHLKALLFALDWKPTWPAVYCTNQTVCTTGISNLARHTPEHAALIPEVLCCRGRQKLLPKCQCHGWSSLLGFLYQQWHVHFTFACISGTSFSHSESREGYSNDNPYLVLYHVLGTYKCVPRNICMQLPLITYNNFMRHFLLSLAFFRWEK